MHRWIPFGLLFFLISCAPSRPPIPPGEVPAPQPITVTDEQYGHQVFQELADRYEQDYNHPRALEVQSVVDRLTAAAGAAKDPWHVYIFKDTSVKNAAATRGNHVFIWSGLLDSTRSEDELAVILAHEIGHVLAGHTAPDPNEEVKKLLINLGAIAAGIAVTYTTNGSFSGQLGDLTSTITQQLGNSLLVYPYDQDNELEADQVGIFLMARAKFNPQAAIDFWSRAENDPDLSGNLGFLSTHPPAGERVERLKEHLPEALRQYNGILPAPKQPSSGSPMPSQPPQPSTNTSPYDPVGDSFDVNANKPPASIVPDISPDKSADGGTVWVVTAGRAVVYQGPTRTSRALGELRRGARVRTAETRGAWLRITQPDEGYVRKDQLREEPPGGATGATRSGGANSSGAVIPNVP